MKKEFLIAIGLVFLLAGMATGAPNTGVSGGGGGTGDVANPMTQDLNLGGFDLTAGGAATFSGVNVSDNPGSNSLLLLDNPASLTSCAPGADNVQIFSNAGVLSVCDDTGVAPIAAGSGRVLLAQATVNSQTALNLIAVDWPATYDSVELEMRGLYPISNARLRFGFLNDGTGGTSYNTPLEYTLTTLNYDGGTPVVTIDSGTRFQSDTSVGGLISAVASRAVHGRVLITKSANDTSLSGYGKWTYRTLDITASGVTTGNFLISTDAQFTLEGSGGVPSVSWDGIRLDFAAATPFSGTAKLWGIPNQ